MAIPLNLCIPLAVGVPNLNPGQPNFFGPPNWLDDGGLPHPLDNTLEDPRWLGTAEQSYGMGSGEDARFRALYSTVGAQTNLYLSWHVELDFQNANVQLDSLFVGFRPPNGTASVIQISVHLDSAIDLGPPITPNAYGTNVWIRSGNTWQANNAVIHSTPTSNWLLNSTRLWVGSPNQNSWAIQMIVPIGQPLTEFTNQPGSGTTLGTNFEMWYSLLTTTPGGQNAVAVQYTWPGGNGYRVNNTTIFPDPANPNTSWSTVNVGNNQAGQPCAAVGVSLTYDTIGNDTAGAPYPGNFTISLNKKNTLFADPTNNDPTNNDPGTSSIGIGEIAARFRLAKWGSQNPSGTWPDVRNASHQVFNTDTIPPTLGTNPGGHSIVFDWTLDPTIDDVAGYTAQPDRCLFIELSSAKNVTFVSESAFKNMLFATTSLFGHEAEISVVGLNPIAGGGPDRDVYLYVETVNMPAFIERQTGYGYPESPGQPESPPVIVERPIALERLDPQALDFGARRIELNKMAAEGRLDIGQANRVLPTYIVHAFHDTGEKVNIIGVDHPVVVEQTSFGYVAVHDGPLYGWKHDLRGDTLQEIAPNFYKIPVPNHGTATVTTIIQSLEHPGNSGGFMVQSTFGKKHNFELVVPNATGGLAHCWRENDNPPHFPWRGPTVFGTSVGQVEAASLIQSSFGIPGNLEVVARVEDRLVHFWRDSGPAFTWNGPFTIAQDISGNPALIQSRFGKLQRNFELVVPLASGGIAHYWHNNEGHSQTWTRSAVFGTNLGHIDAVALVQSNFGQPLPGNLEVVARAGDRLIHFWRDSGPELRWREGFTFFTGATGVPGFIQSRLGIRGDFVVVTPVSKGGMVHLQRNNDDTPSFPWSVMESFGSGNVTAVSLLQSNFTSSNDPAKPGPGNLEVAARVDNRTALYWRRDESPFTWNGPTAYACS